MASVNREKQTGRYAPQHGGHASGERAPSVSTLDLTKEPAKPVTGHFTRSSLGPREGRQRTTATGSPPTTGV